MKALAFLALMLGATISYRERTPYVMSDVFRGAVTVALAVVALVLARWDVVPAWGARLRQVARRRERAFVALLAVFAFGATAAICRFVLDPIPHISDEVAYLFQARIFASGHLSVPAPATPEFFPAEWVVVHRGRWFGIFPPGWPLLLAAGVRLGVPWLVNPALSALSVVAIYGLARRLMGAEKARLAALFCVVSPFFAFMGGSFMSHPAALLFTTLTTLSLLRATSEAAGCAPGGESRRWHAWFLLSGGCAGAAFLIRPLDAGLLWATAAGCLFARSRTRRQAIGTALSAIGLAAGAAVYLAYNHALDGRWFSPLLTLTSPANRLGFGPSVGVPPGHTWRHALGNLNLNAAVMSADLFGWPLSSLTFVFVALCWGAAGWLRRLSLAMIGCLLAGYFCFWYHGVCFGARFYFTLLPFLLVLTVEGLATARRRLAGVPAGSSARFAHALPIFVTLCFAFSLTVYCPIVAFVAPYRNQRSVHPGLAAFAARNHLQQAIVFVDTDTLEYPAGFAANDLDPAAGPIMYAIDRPGHDGELQRRYPERGCYHYAEPIVRPPQPPWLERIVRHGFLIDLLRGDGR
jgi:hypothetical protein